MELKCECLYCGHVFIKHVYYSIKNIDELDLRCEKIGCNDKNVRVVPVSKGDVFGYNHDPQEKKRG